MAWLASRVGHRVVTTADRPFRIAEPTIGFLNLSGATEALIVDGDRTALSHPFRRCEVSSHQVPKCDVLFLYCHLDARGNIESDGSTLGSVIQAAGAYVAVVASENENDRYQRADLGDHSWGANVVMVLNRNGDAFVSFWQRLFEAMFAGESMLMAWVALAPQDRRLQANLPGTIMVAKAGHIAFR
jgi:hypothetical protein